MATASHALQTTTQAPIALEILEKVLVGGEYCGAERPFYEILQAHGWSDIDDAGNNRTIGQIRQVMRAVYEAVVRARVGVEGQPPVDAEVRS